MKLAKPCICIHATGGSTAVPDFRKRPENQLGPVRRWRRSRRSERTVRSTPYYSVTTDILRFMSTGFAFNVLSGVKPNSFPSNRRGFVEVKRPQSKDRQARQVQPPVTTLLDLRCLSLSFNLYGVQPSRSVRPIICPLSLALQFSALTINVTESSLSPTCQITRKGP